MTHKSISALLLVIASGPALAAGTTGETASPSRDSSAAFVATQNFIVGRLGRDCLEEVGRSETPADYQKQWQRRNAKYHDASVEYIAARLDEIPDPAEKEAIEAAYYSSVNERGAAAAAQLLSTGSKADVCKHAISLIDAGKMNIDEFVQATNQSMAGPLAELVEWAEAH